MIWHVKFKNRNKLISTRINEDVLEKLDNFSDKYWLSRAEIIELLIENHLDDLLKFRY